MARLVAKHPLAIRWCHWVNFPVLSLMVWSGLLIYWANDEYEVSLGGRTLVHFFPDWFYAWTGIGARLAEGLAWHLALAWVFALNGAAYVLYVAFSGEWRHLLPTWRTPADAFQVVLHDLGLRREPLPPAKFNGAQRLAYTSVTLMGVGSVLTGLAIAKPVQFAWLTALLGGYRWARFEHFLLTWAFVGFFLVHVAQVIKAGWNNFRAMVIGSEVVEDTQHEPA